MKARVDWMESGKVLHEPVSFAFVRRAMGKYITTSGKISSQNGSVSGQHVTEYSIAVPGKSYTFKYWRPSASTQVCISFLDENDTMISAVYGGSSGQRTATYTVPAGTKKVLVYGIYRTGNLVYSSMTPTVAEGSADVEEMRVKAAGDSVSQIVWPTKNTYTLTNVAINYTGQYRYLLADGSYAAYATADIVVKRGTQITTLTNQTLTPKRISVNDHLVIDNVYTEIFYIDGNYIKAKNLKTAESQYGPACTAVFGYEDQEVELYVEQDHNYIEEQIWRPNSITTTGYKIELSQSDFPTTGGYARVKGYRVFRGYLLNWWTSGATTDVGWAYGQEEKDPSSVTCSGATVIDDTVFFPSNSGTTEKTYTVTGYWSSYHGDATAVVYGSDTGKTYSNLTVSLTYPNNGIIPVTGGSMYPTVSVSIKCDGTTMTGSVSDGSTACSVSGGGMTTVVLLEYYGAENGFVSASTRGTNEDASDTPLATVYVTAKKKTPNVDLSKTSTSKKVYQQRNQKSVYRLGDFHVTNLSVIAMDGDEEIVGSIEAKPTVVTLAITASGSGRTTEYVYTTNEHSGGEDITMTDKPLMQGDLASLSVTAGNADITVTNLMFTADNRHSLSSKTYTIQATYEDSPEVVKTVTQDADEKEDSPTPTYTCTLEEVANTNELSAAGGTVRIIATAYHIAGKIWKSDGAAVENESTTTSDVSSLYLDITQAADYFTFDPISTGTYTKTYEITHRDMLKDKTTDTLSVRAKNGNNKDSSTLSYSVTNTRNETPFVGEWEDYGNKNYGTAVPDDYQVSVSASAFTAAVDGAPFAGGTYSNLLTLSASYATVTPWTQQQRRSLTYSYTSGAEDVEYETRELSGSDTSERIPATPTVVSGEAWLTVATNGSVTFASNAPSGTNTGDARDAVVTASYESVSDTVTLYQKKYISLQVSGVTDGLLLFGPNDTTLSFTVVWERTAWTITHEKYSSSNADPVSSVSPASGGRANLAGETSITVTANSNITNNYFSGKIRITSDEDSSAFIEINVIKQTAEQTLGYYGQITSGTLSAGVATYSWSIRNENRNSATFADVEVRLLYASSYLDNPSSSDLTQLRSNALPSITVPGDGTTTGTGTFSSTPIPSSSDRYYYLQLYSYYFRSPYYYIGQ